MANKKVFFDANILLDIISTSRKNNLIAIQLWESLVLSETEIVISEDILTNVFYISKNKKDVLTFFELIQNRWEIVHFGKNVIQQAITFSLKKSLDLEDLLQCLCAKENNCQIFISNDKKFYNCGLEVLSAETFLEKYEK